MENILELINEFLAEGKSEEEASDIAYRILKECSEDDDEYYVCNFCGASIGWNSGSDISGNIWECESCAKMVCSFCIEKAGGTTSCEAESILCPDCLAAKEK